MKYRTMETIGGTTAQLPREWSPDVSFQVLDAADGDGLMVTDWEGRPMLTRPLVPGESVTFTGECAGPPDNPESEVRWILSKSLLASAGEIELKAPLRGVCPNCGDFYDGCPCPKELAGFRRGDRVVYRDSFTRAPQEGAVTSVNEEVRLRLLRPAGQHQPGHPSRGPGARVRQPLQLTYDPDCNRCSYGLVMRGQIFRDRGGTVGSARHTPKLCTCVEPDKPTRREPCPKCGGLAVKDGRCVGCDLERPA